MSYKYICLQMILKLPKDATLDQFKDQVFRKTGVKPCDVSDFVEFNHKVINPYNLDTIFYVRR